MSEAARRKLKISREGIVLIKSFEGFRPRAIQRAEGGWVIGYGHTLSAREGVTVSEADAELLLRYDLLPVEASVNDALPSDLNQHQFDALVSFAFSVGVDRFAASDVRGRLTSGSAIDAADALLNWPEPILPETAIRRRAAERALFVATPGAPVTLSDLLIAPLPSASKTAGEAVPSPVEETPAAETAPVAVDSRGAAVAALLGEAPARRGQDARSVHEPAPEPVSPSNDNPPVTTELEVAPTEAPPPGASSVEAGPAEPPAEEPAPSAAASGGAAPPAPSFFSRVASWLSPRDVPYAVPMVGPLPNAAPTPETSPTNPASVPDDDASVEAEPPVLAEAVVDPGAPAPAELVTDAPHSDLVVTANETAAEPAFVCPSTSAAHADASAPALFDQASALSQGGPVMRHEAVNPAPARFDWQAATPSIIIGGVGLISFAASLAAFRYAGERPAGYEMLLIGGVLALIGLGCMVVSGNNLYRKMGAPNQD